LWTFLKGGFTPVVAPLGVASDAAHALNLNADAAAGTLAGALYADAYVIVTNVERVRRDVNDPTGGIATHPRRGTGAAGGRHVRWWYASEGAERARCARSWSAFRRNLWQRSGSLGARLFGFGTTIRTESF